MEHTPDGRASVPTPWDPDCQPCSASDRLLRLGSAARQRAWGVTVERNGCYLKPHRHCLAASGLAGDLTACGGGVRTRAWAQIFADVLGRPIRLLADIEVGARGAAQAALRAVGGAPLPPVTGVEVMQPATARGYDDRYATYLEHLAQARTTWRSTA